MSNKYEKIRNYIDGDLVDPLTNRWLNVESPLTGEVIAEVAVSSREDLDKAVSAAKEASKSWSKTPIKDRVQVFYRYKTLLEQNINELAALIQEENGKTLDEARTEIEKSIELTEFAVSLPQLTQGEILEVSKGVECKIERVALGVVASIVPFNFPSMVPNWTIPNAIAL